MPAGNMTQPRIRRSTTLETPTRFRYWGKFYGTRTECTRFWWARKPLQVDQSTRSTLDMDHIRRHK